MHAARKKEIEYHDSYALHAGFGRGSCLARRRLDAIAGAPIALFPSRPGPTERRQAGWPLPLKWHLVGQPVRDLGRRPAVVPWVRMWHRNGKFRAFSLGGLSALGVARIVLGENASKWVGGCSAWG
jgi:hypothetical protein